MTNHPPETIYDQKGAARIIPALAFQSDSPTHSIVITPREEIRLDAWVHEGACGCTEVYVDVDPVNCPNCKGTTAVTPIARVTVTGDDQLLRYEHVTSLRDQCATAGVDFKFPSWGVWAPNESIKEFSLRSLGRQRVLDGRTYWAVGRANSGNLLDGVQHLPKEEAGI